MDSRLREGINLFNEGRFFESHEKWESFYHETEDVNMRFLEGLIQLAVAFRLVRDLEEVKGPVRMVYQALIRFENYHPAFLQIRVDKLYARMEAWAKEAESTRASSTIPKIPPADVLRRLAALQTELDQCWDLLRQRRALREFGHDPAQAKARPADVVKKYTG
jgi:predicted metal-dependent hydrolase